MTRPKTQPVADHITTPTACGDSALVSGPLAGGAADAHPSGTLRSTGGQPPAATGARATKATTTPRPRKLPPDESRLPPGTGFVIAAIITAAFCSIIAAIIITNKIF